MIKLPRLSFLCVLSLALMLSLGAQQAHAKSVLDGLDPTQGLSTLTVGDEFQIVEAMPLSSGEMGELRGGFFDASGFMFKFAVDIKSQIDGALTFVRSLVLQTTQPGKYEASSAAQVVATEPLPQGTTVQVVDKGAGVVLKSEGGETKVINQTQTGSFTNVIVNTADNRNITQTMNIDLVVQNMKSHSFDYSSMRHMHSPSGLFNASRMHSLGFGF